MTIKVGDIIQIVKDDHPWFPCILIVSEVKSWGVQADCLIPTSNIQRDSVSIAPIRLDTIAFQKVGRVKFNK